MGKRRRRSARTGTGNDTPRRAKTAEDEELHRGEYTAAMPRPNQLVPLEPYDEMPRMRFPLLSLEFHEDDWEEGEKQGIFFDSDHGPLWWEFTDRAPTWMDPHVFIEMCKQDPEIQAALKRIFRKNRAADARRKLVDLLDEVMQETYLVYMLEMFELAKPYLADWLARHHCYQETDPNAPKPQRGRGKQSPGREAE
jgi:hypothetical protein